MLPNRSNADERSRTSTPRGAQAPEACASANSATSASFLLAYYLQNSTSINANISNFLHFVKDFSPPVINSKASHKQSPALQKRRIARSSVFCSRINKISLNYRRQLSETKTTVIFWISRFLQYILYEGSQNVMTGRRERVSQLHFMVPYPYS